MSVDPSPILDLIEAFRRSKTMFTAVSMGIFDRLGNSHLSAAALAEIIPADRDALERLLDACVGLGLLSRTPGGYANTGLSANFLATNGPETLAGYILYSDRTLYPLWGHLDDAIKEGSNRWAQTFGSKGALFDHFFRNEEAQRSFLNGMHGVGSLSSPKIAQVFDLSSFSRLVDLGGASGHLCIAACQAYPALSAAVFDLPSVQRFAEEKIAASPVAERIRFVPGDFFLDELPPADLYSLGRVLHDWKEDKITHLLKKIFEALPSGGGLLLGECLLDDNRCGPMSGLMQNLNMLVVTDGKERSCPEYRVLLDAAGFRSIQCRRTGSVVDAVLARKP